MSGLFSTIYRISIIILIFLLFRISFAEEKKVDGFFSENLPIEITSERLVADNTKNRAVFEGSVMAKQGETILKADWMEVTYNDQGEVIKIHAKGNVKIQRNDKEVVSEEVEYLRQEGKIIFTGNPVATSPNSRISGKRITYFIEDGRSVVEESKVILNTTESK
jgi:lipopolysaccharide export system protein LptA